MNALRVVNTFLRSNNRYVGTLSRVMVSIHPDELCYLKDSIETLESHLHKTISRVNLLEIRLNNFQNKNDYHVEPKLQKLTERINNISNES